MVVRGSAWLAASWTSRSGTPASKLGGSDERVAQRVWANSLVDPGSSGDPSNDPGCSVSIEPSAGAVAEDRPFAAFTNGKIDSARGAWGERDRHGLAALAVDDEGAVTAFETELFDVRADRLGHAQPVQRDQRDQRVIAGASEAGGDQHGADLVAVQTGRVGLVVQAWSTDVNGR